MRRTLKGLCRAAIFAGVALSLGGCAARAKVITGITSANDQIKFLYVQGQHQGLVKCTVGAEGALSKCHEMVVVLEP